VSTVVGNIKIKVSFSSGNSDKRIRSLNKSTAQLASSLRGIGTTLRRVGRTLSITSFVMGIVARQMVKHVTGIGNAIMGVVKESANMDRAMKFLSDTLYGLALSGMLTDDRFSDVMSTWQGMMDDSMQLSGILASLNEKFQSMKNAVAEGAIPSLQDLDSEFNEFDLSGFNAILEEATNAFLTPIVDKIKELIGDEKSGLEGLRSKIVTIASLGGEFAAGFLEGIDKLLTKVSEFIGDDTEGATGMANKLGEISAYMLAFAPGGAVIGSITSGFGTLLNVTGSLIGRGGVIGVGTGLLGIIAVLGGVALTTDEGKKAVGHLADAFADLADALDVDLLGAIQSVGKRIAWLIDLTAKAIEKVASLIRKIREVESSKAEKLKIILKPGSTETQVESNPLSNWVEGRQGGGFIHRTGTYLLHRGEMVVPRNQVYNAGNVTINISGGDPYSIAREVERVLAKRSRSPFLPR